MREQGNPNKGLELVRGSKWGTWESRIPSRRPRLHVPNSWLFDLDARVSEAAAAVGSVSRPWAKVISGESMNHRVIGRRVLEAHAAGIPLERVLKYLDAPRAWACKLYAERPMKDRQVSLQRINDALNDDPRAA